ncbi:MAG: hypothetical protein H0T89_26100 [Deltaproteobacteria bacterium]|nr:hypothetical protein [Deltaproteobacteria bacterium]MDQ3301589.1 hypothetical protein [Myxococcota bacterium]
MARRGDRVEQDEVAIDDRAHHRCAVVLGNPPSDDAQGARIGLADGSIAAIFEIFGTIWPRGLHDPYVMHIVSRYADH